MTGKPNGLLSEAETAKRRDAAILKALKTPPSPHKNPGKRGKIPSRQSQELTVIRVDKCGAQTD